MTAGLDAKTGGHRPPLQKTNSVLEERGRTTSPGFAFFFGDAFNVFHVGAGLGQHMVEIVSDALEEEALIQELADARGSEQEDSKNDVILLRVRPQLFLHQVFFFPLPI